MPIPGFQDRSDGPPSVEDESYDHEAYVSPNARPSEDGGRNSDLQEARFLFGEIFDEQKKIGRRSQCS